MQDDLFGKTRADLAIARLREFEPPEGYYLAFSGGKDSVCLLALADLAGVKYDAHYSVTTADPPELVRFIKEHYPAVTWDRPTYTMWQLIERHTMPPTRIARYCCNELKEDKGKGRRVLTGIRWAESRQRSQRPMVDVCYKQSKHYLHPMIDWADEDVWGFIRERGLAYCSLYDEGFDRLGCVMCPMKRRRAQLVDAERWPRFYGLYLRAFGKMIAARHAKNKACSWETAQDVMDWWLNEQDGSDVDERQVPLW